jgi:hypothetical protein
MTLDSIERRFTRVSDSRFVLDVPDLCIVFDADRVRRDRWDALRAELTVRCDLPGAGTIDGVLFSGDVDLSNRTRQDLPRQLAARARTKDVDWSLLVDELAIRVRDAERVGQPAVSLRDVARPGADDIVHVSGLRLPLRHPSILFGDGASGKSYLALHVAGELQRAGHAVGIFDWEMDAADHRDRLERLYGADMPNLRYARCRGPLVTEVDRLSRIVHEHRLTYAILDSIGFACAGPPEAAEHATAYIRALRSLGIGSLNLAHVSKAGEASEHRPFGSTFWHAGARMTWFVKSESAPGSDTLTLGAFNRKNNIGPPLPAVGFEVTFTDDRTQIRRTDLTSSESLAGRLTTYERVTSALKRGPMTVAALAQSLDMKVDSIEKFCKRRAQSGALVRLEAIDGVPTRYALADRRVVS